MINVLISNARLVAAQQKKAGKGCVTKQLLAFGLPQSSADFTAAAKLLRERLNKLKVRDKALHIILGEQVVFKEFQHQPVSARSLAGFARIEARAVLRENAEGYSVAHMCYGTRQNEQGEQTSMLLAVPTELLKELRAAFGGAGFRVDSVHSQFSCYSAVMARVLPVLAPELTGAAIDFGYEATLINLYQEGSLVSQRRLASILDCLAEPVMEDTGCTAAEVSEKLAQNKFSPAYAPKAQAAITNFTYDILRSLRVLAAPLHIMPERFVLTGAACRDTVFLRFVMENLDLPCVVADDEQARIAKLIAPHGSLTGLFVLAGPLYDSVDLLDAVREKQKSTAVNLAACVVLTGIVALGLAVQPMELLIEQSMVNSAQKRYESLADIESRIGELSAAKAQMASLAAKADTLAQYTSNTGKTLPRALAFFENEDFALQVTDYTSEDGAYQATFIAKTKEDFLRLKDKIYADKSYYLNLSMSIVRQREDKSYLCQLYFVPADYIPLPEAEPAPEAEDAQSASTGDGTQDLLEGIGG
ncbi:MAG: hypothetical protein RRZ93_00010 [Ruthenibacterium sp.]